MNVPIAAGRREWIWFVATGVLFAALLYLADLGEFLAALVRTDPSHFAVAFVVGFSSLLLWAWVWHRFFRHMGMDPTPSGTVTLFLTGHFLNSITPLGQFGGEPIMAYVVSDSLETDYEKALAAVVSADILNAAPFFTFTFGGLSYLVVVGSLNGFLRNVGAVSMLLLLVGIVLAYLLWSEDATLVDAAVGALHAIEARIDRAEGLVRSLRDRVVRIEGHFQTAGRDPSFLAATAVVSHLAILAQIVSLYFVFLSLGIEPDLVSLYFIVNLSVIATISPTPGGSGTYEVVFSGLVTLFYPVGLATAVTAAVLFRLTTYWPGLLAGYLSLFVVKGRSVDDGADLGD
ncbi:lysylphosphatidylglycerol synthase transmembrane domain-containing protein [Halopenitus persicus]|uniref:Lysylphosphatidylglycerol synthase TM region n=1 Tax=Halopenitus persicus TaxID=1048396 RepID=A0A1H3IVU8_9EURY|nr:lysylphosphatidylglycerol synthase transmembrane domain-containing protein [Halopenitus persicus]QHS17266.1 flippase-like domain-containing protein [haloarchaeon 3A1-DGR]SDY31024.1 hypothetical protein SAMN05216564_104256 [Halopenitus persicus]